MKVTAKLQWNSRDNGYAMTGDEMASMTDAYQYIDKDATVPKTDYIMQTMWRDHTSHWAILYEQWQYDSNLHSVMFIGCYEEIPCSWIQRLHNLL